MNSLLDAFAELGEGIDKFTGGRALRGALGGKPRELMSVLPFSDTIGLTDASQKTSGRDLTDAYGITAKGASDFGSGAAGFLADTILSPGNLIGGAAAFKAAPTIGKGITAGAKALTGLDLFDSFRAAKPLAAASKVPEFRLPTPAKRSPSLADAVRGFAGDERGSLDIGAMLPKGKAPFVPDATRLDALRADTDFPTNELYEAFLAKNATPENRSWWKGEFGKEHKQWFDHYAGRNASAKAAPGYDIAHANDELVRRMAVQHGGADAMYVKGMGSMQNEDFVRPWIDFARAPEHAPGATQIADAVNAYTGSGSGFDTINKYLRGGSRGHRPRELDDLLKAFDVSRVPEGIPPLHRGIGGDAVSEIEKAIGVPLNSPEAIGRAYTDPGVLSTTLSKGVAKDFASGRYSAGSGGPGTPGVTFEFPDVKPGAKAAPIHPGESEIAFPPGRQITIRDNSQYPKIRADLLSYFLAIMGAGGYAASGDPGRSTNGA